MLQALTTLAIKYRAQIFNRQKIYKMKKLIFTLLAIIAATTADAQKSDKHPIMTFEKKSVSIGTFPAEDAIRKCYFVFTNTGEADLYIHQAFASCGCTVPQVPEEAIKPGDSDTIFVTYDGRRKAPGNIRKSITIHNNSKDEMIRLYITGKMLPAKEQPVDVIEVEED